MRQFGRVGGMSSLHTTGERAVNEPPAERWIEKVTLLLGRLTPLLVLLAGLVAFFVLDLDSYISLEALKENREALAAWVEGAGAFAWLVYILVYAALVAFSAPVGALLTIAGGFLFGPWLGGMLAVVAATLGATALFLAARYAFAELLRQRAGAAVEKMRAGFNENALSYMLFLRLIPVFPFFLVNLVPAFLGVGLGTYVLGTALGIIPGTFVYASLGDGFSAIVELGGDIDLGIIFEPRFLFPMLGLAGLSLLPVLYKRIRGRRAQHPPGGEMRHDGTHQD